MTGARTTPPPVQGSHVAFPQETPANQFQGEDPFESIGHRTQVRAGGVRVRSSPVTPNRVQALRATKERRNEQRRARCSRLQRIHVGRLPETTERIEERPPREHKRSDVFANDLRFPPFFVTRSAEAACDAFSSGLSVSVAHFGGWRTIRCLLVERHKDLHVKIARRLSRRKNCSRKM